MQINLQYTVASTGRSGTLFMARLLTSVGILCGHETIFSYDGIDAAKNRIFRKRDLELSKCSFIKYDEITDNHLHVDSWHPDINNIVADSSYMVVPFLKDEVLSSTTIIHLVRNPISVINSFCNSLDYFNNNTDEESLKYEGFIFNHLPEIRHLSQYDAAALYYVKWNQMIEEKKPDFFFRIEDDPKLVLDFLSIPKNVNHFNEVGVNTFKKIKTGQFNLSKVQDRNIRLELYEMSKKYGYNSISFT